MSLRRLGQYGPQAVSQARRQATALPQWSRGRGRFGWADDRTGTGRGARRWTGRAPGGPSARPRTTGAARSGCRSHSRCRNATRGSRSVSNPPLALTELVETEGLSGGGGAVVRRDGHRRPCCLMRRLTNHTDSGVLRHAGSAEDWERREPARRAGDPGGRPASRDRRTRERVRQAGGARMPVGCARSVAYLVRGDLTPTVGLVQHVGVGTHGDRGRPIAEPSTAANGINSARRFRPSRVSRGSVAARCGAAAWCRRRSGRREGLRRSRRCG